MTLELDTISRDRQNSIVAIAAMTAIAPFPASISSGVSQILKALTSSIGQVLDVTGCYRRIPNTSESGKNKSKLGRNERIFSPVELDLAIRDERT